MAEEETNQERTEEATEHRRKEFREQGRIPVSRDLIAVIAMLVVVPAVSVGGAGAMGTIGSVIRTPLLMVRDPHGAFDTLGGWAPQLVGQALMAIAPAFLLMWVVSVLVGVAQTKANLTFKVLSPKLDKLNPVEGIKKLVGSQAWIELLKSLLKLAAVLLAAVLVLRADHDLLMALDRSDLHRSLDTLGQIALRLMMATTIALLAAAAVDYGLQIHQINKRMRMTRDELKRDIKEQDGDPLIKSRRRRMAQNLSANRMISQVREADVVVTNPDHVAVALRYVHGVTEVPQVVAAGADQVALRIRAEARRYAIPQVENRLLARTLYQRCRVGDAIPVELFGPVAEILSFVHQVRGLRGMDPVRPQASRS